MFRMVLVALCLTVLCVSCGGGGDSSTDTSGGGGNGGGGVTTVTVSGTITYDYVPVGTGGLLYASTEQRPVRGAVVELLSSSGSVTSSTTTTDAGAYSFTAQANQDVSVRIKAQLLKATSPTWDFQVVDNTNAGALYSMQGVAFNTGTSNQTKNYNAPSGWGGSGYTSTRVSAPFAILDTMYSSANKVAIAMTSSSSMRGQAVQDMTPLKLNWSPNNVPASGDLSLGQIGTSHYNGGSRQLYILGSANTDTDEFDHHVIAHEWAHYFEDNLSRSDSIGGPHGMGDKLDPRVAFGEGFGNAFSAMALDEPHYMDSYGPGQSTIAVHMDMETNRAVSQSVGWYSESSVQSILYDLYDSTNDGPDAVSLGFTPVYRVMAERQTNADAMTTIYSFSAAMKELYPASSNGINTLLAYENISTQADQFDSALTETNNGGQSTALPVYKFLNAGSTIELCVIANDDIGTFNKFTNRRFFYFQVPSQGSYRVTVTPDSSGDPMMAVYRKGQSLAGYIDNGANGGAEQAQGTLDAGYYVGEVLDYNHMAGSATGQECYNITLTRL